MCKACHIKKSKANKKKHNENSELATLRRKKYNANRKADPVKRAKYREMKNKWNKSDKYFDGYFKRKFGISLNDVNAMLSIQNGLCANIGCCRSIAILPSDEQFKSVVDHDHDTGKVRSLMCVRCNSLLGHIEKDQKLIPGLMDYLNKHK